ncbi:MAG: 50S ribosomal protein L9 [Acidobacteria bacterium]|nr:MAG: 50S ribosomal protein L9 [Acidobacteriota bacterium]
MAATKVILLEDTRRLGKRGSTVKVKPGYARNYLIPQGIALEATPGNVAFFEQQKKKIDARHLKKIGEAQELAAQIAGLSVSIAKRVGEKETLYGSVTTAEIAERLARQGITVDKRRIHIAEGGVGIKTLGEHKVTIDLHPEVTAELTVNVVAEE